MARSMQLNNNQGQIKMKGLKNMKMRMLATVLIIGVCLSMQADDAAYRKALSEAKMAEAEKKADSAYFRMGQMLYDENKYTDVLKEF